MEIIKQYEELMQQIQDKTVTEEMMEEFLKVAEKLYQKEANTCLSFNHPVEACYYEYYVSKEEYVRVPVNMGYLYRTLGMMYEKENKLRKAETSYNRAYRWNPIDLDTMYCMIEFYKKEKDLDKMLRMANRCYSFSCTRADIAHYYRNLGFYYLENYKVDLAEALYGYSQCFYETKQAESELAYLAKAKNSEVKTQSVETMQQILKNNKIEIQPSETTLAITYQVGKAFLQAGDVQGAKDCFLMVYDLTHDEEIAGLLSQFAEN